ncbi:MAG: transposase [Colwellia sp.]|nr:transposase [Colwellia sp.]
MHDKNIKRIVKKQLKKQFPNWKRLRKREKKEISKQVLEEVVREYSYEAGVKIPINELLGIPNIESANIMTLSDIEQYIKAHNRNILKFTEPSKGKYIKDNELIGIDALLDNGIINKLIAPEGYTASMRVIKPFQLLRAELLKCLKYPEISYRKYCSSQLNKLEQKENRAFVMLPLHKKLCISHSQLSQFRNGLSFSQLVNLMVYIIYLFKESGRIDSKSTIHAADSSEIPAICNPAPLATIEIKGKKVRIYSDLDADCGKRRKKRDKSEYFVGYRIHTLTAINAQTGESYPLISLVAPGNHHDSLFLEELIVLGKGIGLELRVLIADEAYGDGERSEAIRRQHKVTVVTPPRGKVKIPDNVDKGSHAVYMDELCEIPMRYIGKTDKGSHEFSCDANTEECIRSGTCNKCREIPIDAGVFGQIPEQVSGVNKLRDLRKNSERPFNLLKHREGLEPLRVRSQHGLTAVATFANMANLLLEIVATRKTKRKENPQQKLKLAA